MEMMLNKHEQQGLKIYEDNLHIGLMQRSSCCQVWRDSRCDRYATLLGVSILSIH